MATYVITDSPDVDWEQFDWETAVQYKHRHESSDGRPTAQEEFDARRNEGRAAVLWKFENNQPREMERCNI
jgi:hypothetical protein